MKRLFLTVLCFLTFGLYNVAMSQTVNNEQKRPDFSNRGKYVGTKKNGKMHGKGVYE